MINTIKEREATRKGVALALRQAKLQRHKGKPIVFVTETIAGAAKLHNPKNGVIVVPYAVAQKLGKPKDKF